MKRPRPARSASNSNQKDFSGYNSKFNSNTTSTTNQSSNAQTTAAGVPLRKHFTRNKNATRQEAPQSHSNRTSIEEHAELKNEQKRKHGKERVSHQNATYHEESHANMTDEILENSPISPSSKAITEVLLSMAHHVQPSFANSSLPVSSRTNASKRGHTNLEQIDLKQNMQQKEAKRVEEITFEQTDGSERYEKEHSFRSPSFSETGKPALTSSQLRRQSFESIKLQNSENRRSESPPVMNQFNSMKLSRLENHEGIASSSSHSNNSCTASSRGSFSSKISATSKKANKLPTQLKTISLTTPTAIPLNVNNISLRSQQHGSHLLTAKVVSAPSNATSIPHARYQPWNHLSSFYVNYDSFIPKNTQNLSQVQSQDFDNNFTGQTSHLRPSGFELNLDDGISLKLNEILSHGQDSLDELREELLAHDSGPNSDVTRNLRVRQHKTAIFLHTAIMPVVHSAAISGISDVLKSFLKSLAPRVWCFKNGETWYGPPWFAPMRIPSIAELQSVHNREQVIAVLSMCKWVDERRFFSLSVDQNPSEPPIIRPGTMASVFLSAGSIMHAIEAVIAGRCLNAFVPVSPQGRHAGWNFAHDSCLINHIALGAMHVLNNSTFSRLAVIDFSIHTADGIENVFQQSGLAERTLLIDIDWPELSKQFATNEHAASLSRDEAPVHPKSVCHLHVKNDEFYTVLSQLRDALYVYDPEFILVSAAFDRHICIAGSDLSLDLVDAEYEELMRVILDCAANSSAHGRVVSILDSIPSTLNLDDTVRSHIQCLMEKSMQTIFNV